MARRGGGACRKDKLAPTLAERVAEASKAQWERPWKKDFSDAPIFLRYGPSPGMGVEGQMLWKQLGKKKPRKAKATGANKSHQKETS